MLANKARIAFKQAFLILCFVSLLQFFFQSYCNAQTTEPQDQPIDPNQLKTLSPSALQNYLRDKNQNQSQPGEDIHKKNPLKNETKVVKDSTVKDENKKIIIESLKYLSDKNLINVYAFVIMPNHLHCILHFPEPNFDLNKIISNAKRFMAYEIVNRCFKPF